MAPMSVYRTGKINTAGRIRTYDRWIWNPMLYQAELLPYQDIGLRRHPGFSCLLTLDFMKRVLAKAWAVLIEPFLDPVFDAALDVDRGSVVQVTGFGTLKPDILACL